jgi:uncharacterized Ntn-hydrolase superfamily protein
MLRFLLMLPLLLFATVLHAQHTFSIVAVDPVTGEVGSAGASCLGLDVSLISDVHPGVGAIHTQAQYSSNNQAVASDLLNQGYTPQQIVDTMVAYDVDDNSSIRQYGVAVLAGGGASAAFTGVNCMDYKGHRLGPTYSIQGNILLGPQILDSMEARFLRTGGTLADRLMAALQGANVAGADTRCMPYGTSSLASFLRVARPGDAADKLYLDLRAVVADGSVEPIDTLQKMYDGWKASTSGVPDRSPDVVASLSIRPNSSSSQVTIHYRITESSLVRLVVVDELGRIAATLVDRERSQGEYDLRFDTAPLAGGIYYCVLTAGDHLLTGRFRAGDR